MSSLAYDAQERRERKRPRAMPDRATAEANRRAATYRENWLALFARGGHRIIRPDVHERFLRVRQRAEARLAAGDPFGSGEPPFGL